MQPAAQPTSLRCAAEPSWFELGLGLGIGLGLGLGLGIGLGLGLGLGLGMAQVDHVEYVGLVRLAHLHLGGDAPG